MPTSAVFVRALPRVLCLTLLAAAPAAAQARAPFHIGGVDVPAGTRRDLDWPRPPAGLTDGATRVPVTVFHGAAAGPCAGAHRRRARGGIEFVPIS